jgi:hypothetical protein
MASGTPHVNVSFRVGRFLRGGFSCGFSLLVGCSDCCKEMCCQVEMFVGHDGPMLKQALGFALLGAVIAVLGAALGLSSSQSGGYYGYVAGTSFVTDGVETQAWTVLLLAALAGAVVGCIAGAALHAGGVCIHAGVGSRVGRVVSAGLAGTLVGSSPALVVVGRSFLGLDVGRAVVEWMLALYAVSAVLGYVCALAAIYAVLRASGDSRPRRTLRVVAATLPVGALLATAAGMGVAWMLGYATSLYTVVAVCISVVVIIAATFTLAGGRDDDQRSEERSGS